MKFFDLIRFAFSNFLRRKARSFLTVLGVIIGTASVVIMISIGVGMNVGFEEQISSYGNLRQITIYRSWSSQNEKSGILNIKGINSIKQLDHVEACTPITNTSLTLVNKRQTANIQVVGLDISEFDKLGYGEIKIGRTFDETDIGTSNMIMTYNVPFYFSDPKTDTWYVEVQPGQELPFDPTETNLKMTFQYDYLKGPQSADKPNIKPSDIKCIGILEQKENDYNNCIYMDIEVLTKLRREYEKKRSDFYKSQAESDGGYYGGGTNMENKETEYDSAIVLCDSRENVTNLEKEIRALGFETYSSMEYLEQMKEQTAFLRSILGAIGVIAFFIAAISITNTMIMSIYERTREIGIMKVIGCKVSDIRKMFLIEAGIIGFTGGALGLGLSYLTSMVINIISRDSGGILGFSMGTDVSVIPVWMNGAAMALATIIGIVSGLYPAIRATKLQALEAIKSSE